MLKNLVLLLFTRPMTPQEQDIISSLRLLALAESYNAKWREIFRGAVPHLAACGLPERPTRFHFMTEQCNSCTTVDVQPPPPTPEERERILVKTIKLQAELIEKAIACLKSGQPHVAWKVLESAKL